MRPLMLECSFREVRHCAAKLIERCFEHSHRHNPLTIPSDPDDTCHRLLSSLVSLLEKDVATYYKNSSQLFWVIAAYAKMVTLFGNFVCFSAFFRQEKHGCPFTTLQI